MFTLVEIFFGFSNVFRLITFGILGFADAYIHYDTY